MKQIKINLSGFKDSIILDKLTPFQGELKSITTDALERLKKSIIKHGVINPFLIWKKDDVFYVEDGHQRRLALLSLREEGWTIPYLPIVQVLAENEKDAKEKLTTLALSMYGHASKKTYLEFLAANDLKHEDFKDYLETADLNFKFIDDDNFRKEDDTVEKAIAHSEFKPKLGEVWKLGKHRLMVGDCTKRENFQKLMGKELVDLLLTDPPYGVDYSEKNKLLNRSQKGNRIQKPIENDGIGDKRKFFEAFLSNIKFSQYNSFFIFMSDEAMLELFLAFKSLEFKKSQLLVWVKNNHVLGMKDYLPKHELCAYGWKGKHKFYAEKTSSILSYNKPIKNDLHPTMKPIDMLKKLILDGSKEGMNVYDPFLGSGSTLIAAEQTKRKCFGFEIDPTYCGIILQRFKNITGQTPELLPA